jgi:hypothetical protein
MVNTGFISGGSPVVSTLTDYPTNTFLQRGITIEKKLTYLGERSGIVSGYLSLIDLRTNKNNGVLDLYTLDTKINVYAADQVNSIVPLASSLQDGFVKLNKIYYLSTVSYQFWS